LESTSSTAILITTPIRTPSSVVRPAKYASGLRSITSLLVQQDEFRFNLPAGSYIPEVNRAAVAPLAVTLPEALPLLAAIDAVPRQRRRFHWPYVAAAAATLICVCALLIAHARQSPLERFWSPLLDGYKTVLVWYQRSISGDAPQSRQTSAGRPESLPVTIATSRTDRFFNSLTLSHSDQTFAGTSESVRPPPRGQRRILLRSSPGSWPPADQDVRL
jgi:hypothetical protein